MTNHSQTYPLPFRPRLADHTCLRRRISGQQEQLFIRDERAHESYEIDERTARIINCADGTRDLGGIVLATVQSGVFRRISEVHQVLVELHQLGLLTDGISPGIPTPKLSPDRPLQVLPDFLLTCDCNGTCCSSHDGVSFTVDEAERARALVPDVLASERDAALAFLPLMSSGEGSGSPVRTVTMVDGRCPYLTENGHCRIQLAGGPEAKPRGCRIFPATFVDDGQAIRVSVLLECPCVVTSLGNSEGTTLVPEGACVEADLLSMSPIIRLPPTIAVTQDISCSTAELRAWTDKLIEKLADVTNPVALLWDIAENLADGRLSPVIELHPTPPPASNLGYSLMRLASAAQSLAQKVNKKSSRKRSVFDLLKWVARSADTLVHSEACDSALAPPIQQLELERFYLRALLFGHHLALGRRSLQEALRDRALRLLLARQLERDRVQDRPQHPASSYPLVVVEAVMRGQGLELYL